RGPLAPGMTVHHVDSDKRNNRLSNLKAMSLEQNRLYAERDGLLRSFKGENNPRAKLKEADVLEIRRRWADGESVRKLAREYDLSERSVYLMCYRETWKHLE